MVIGGCNEKAKQRILQLIGFAPFGFLGVPITRNELSEAECIGLVEKITNQKLVIKAFIIFM